MPVVIPILDQGLLQSPNDTFRFPEIYVAAINNAKIFGGTNLVLTKNGVICHDLYDFTLDYTSEELHGRILINPKSNKMRWLLHDKAPEQITVAATFVDACANNYAHWITEVLPRIAMFCSDERFKSISIVVNDALHKNIMESLLVVVGNEREIITLPIGRALIVDLLYVTSVAGYVPFERRSTKLSGHSDGIFSPYALELLRNNVYKHSDKDVQQDWPEKVYLRRNSGTRKVINAIELENLLVSRGYKIVEPEKLTFLQQVQLFRNAKNILAPTGAGLSNAVFCRPGTQVIVLMAKHKNMIYRYWYNMLSPIKIKVSYVLGQIVESKSLGIHGDFAVDTSDVLHLLDVLENK